MLLVGLPLHELAMPNALAEVSKEADLAKVSKEADLAIALVQRPHLSTVIVEVVLGETAARWRPSRVHHSSVSLKAKKGTYH